MRYVHGVCCAAILLGTTCVCAAAGQPDLAEDAQLGTLFYSPSERTAIERNRSGSPVVNEQQTAKVQVNGVVRRASGKGTVWLNNRAQAEGQAGVLDHAPNITRNGVHINGAPVRVGETIDLSTRQRDDIVPQGAVKTKAAR